MMHELERFARGENRLIERSELLRSTISASTWSRLVRDGRLIEIFPGVAGLPGITISAVVRIDAAVRAAGRGALASHRSAAYLYGASVIGDNPVDLIRPDRGGALCLPDVVVHRPVDRRELQPRFVNGIPVTNPLRTVVDLGAVAPQSVEECLMKMRIDGHVSVSAVDMAIARHSKKGRPGTIAIRQALAHQVLRARPPDSVLEEKMARLCARYKLPSMEFHARVGGYEVDFLVTDTNIYVECDGWEFHGLNREQFEFDRKRNADLLGQGFIGLKFTWLQIVRNPQYVARMITQAVEKWAPK